jgi:succinyl-diaminopimelate desuccinylase
MTIALGLVADEETGSKYGLCHLLHEHGDLFDKNDLIVVPDSGNPKGTAIEVAEKSILWARFQTRGKQTHGSEPGKGINAHKAAAYLTTRLDTLYSRFRKRDDLFDPPLSTFEPTRHDANVENINTIPGEDVTYFDCRVLPHYKLSEVIKVMRGLVRETEKKFRVKIQVEFPQKETAAPPTSTDAPVVVAIARAVRELRRRRPRAIGIGGGTVAKHLREAGFPCVVWSTMDERAHTPDEYALIPYILDDAKVFAHVAMQEAP